MTRLSRARGYFFGFLIFLSACLAYQIVWPTRACAQTDAASISGRVMDESNAVVPGVEVEIKNVDTGVTQITKTNADGFYSFPYLKPGRYLMNVRRAAFRTISLTGITLHVQDEVSRNFVLKVGSADVSITVTADQNNINTKDAAVSTVVDRQFVGNMPLNGRSFQDLLTLAPGVAIVGYAGNGGNTAPGVAGEITVNGQRTEANSFTVDGVSANVGTGPGSFGNAAGYGGGTPAETALGTTQSIVSVDALQEFRATTSTYSAEYGRTPGGQFSFTTRSGTNDWHGSAFDYFRNEALDANNWFNNAVIPQVPREKERQNDFGGTLGGPIRIPHIYEGKDRTFFFFSYEGLRLWTPQGLETLSVPDQALRQQAPTPLQPVLNAFPLPNKGEDGLNDGLGIYQVGISNPSSIDSVSVRVDQKLGDRFELFGRYADTPSMSSSYLGAVKSNTVINNRLLTLGLTTLITSRQSNELRFNVTQANSFLNQVSTNDGGAVPFDITTLPGPNGNNLPANGSGLFVAFGFGNASSIHLGQSSNSQRQYNVTDSYSWTLGHHSLKFGMDWRRLATYATPVLGFLSVQFPSEASVLNNNVGSSGAVRLISNSPAPVEPLYRNFSAFVQDGWRVTPRLTLSLGLRWDVNPAPTNLTGPSPYTLNQISNLDTAQLAPSGTPLWKTDWHGFAPRLGAAYQLRQMSGHETVLRMGFGTFYDMGSAQGSNGFLGIGFGSRTAFRNVGFPATAAQWALLPPPNIAPPYSSTVYAFDPNLALPYTLQWNVALEQALGSKQSITVTYVGSGGRQLLEQYQILPANNPNFGPGGGQGVYITKNGQTSDYNALQIEFRRTVSHGLQALVAYTYSHSIDEASSNFQLTALQERASSDFDMRHNFQAALTYDVPGEYSNSVLSGLLRHWAIDTRITARSALPVDIFGNFAIDAATGAEVNYHPNLVTGQPLYLKSSQYPGGKIINYNAFIVPDSGPGFDSEGSTPRNYARGFGAWQLNFAVRREFPIHEGLRLQFRAEAFNLFNHPSFLGLNPYWFSGPYNSSCFCGFGSSTGTLNNSIGGLNGLYQTGGPRSLQIAVKLIF